MSLVRWDPDRERTDLLYTLQQRVAKEVAERTTSQRYYLGENAAEKIAKLREDLAGGDWVSPSVAAHLGQAELALDRVTKVEAAAQEILLRLELLSLEQLRAERSDQWRWP